MQGREKKVKPTSVEGNNNHKYVVKHVNKATHVKLKKSIIAFEFSETIQSHI